MLGKDGMIIEQQQQQEPPATAPPLWEYGDFIAAVKMMKPGDEIVYHIGNLLVDRDDAAVARIADAARTFGFPTGVALQFHDYAATANTSPQFGMGVATLAQRRLPGDPAGHTGAVQYVLIKL